MSLFEFGGPQFGLDDAKIASWQGDGTYGTPVDVPSVQMMGAGIKTVNATLEGDDKETDSHAIAISGEVKLRFGSVSFNVLEILTGISRVESLDADSTSLIETLRLGNFKAPYFGLAGRALSTQDDGDTHLFIPKCKVMEGFDVGMNYGQYVIPEVTCKAVEDENYESIFDLIRHEAAAPVDLPPDWGTYASP